jgi:putative flippase GtrA
MPSGRDEAGGSPLGRFAVVGVANTAIDFAVFGLLAVLGVPILLANFVSTSAGMTFSFLVNRSWTFRSTRSVRSSLGPFVLVTAVGLWVIQPVVILLVGDLLDALVPTMATDLRSVWLPKAVAIGVGLIWNFSWYRRTVFRPAAETLS